MYRSYGGNWPIAFYPYYNESIDKNIDTPQCGWLMQIEYPLNYLGARYAARLSIPKYIISASGDDFFVLDSASFYYDRLPSSKVIRMIIDSSTLRVPVGLPDSGWSSYFIEATFADGFVATSPAMYRSCANDRANQTWHESLMPEESVIGDKTQFRKEYFFGENRAACDRVPCQEHFAHWCQRCYVLLQ